MKRQKKWMGRKNKRRKRETGLIEKMGREAEEGGERGRQ